MEMPIPFASRENVILNRNRSLHFGYQVQYKSSIRVDLPHIWNAQDAPPSDMEKCYHRADAYEITLNLD
jgi:hypothetical protein